MSEAAALILVASEVQELLPTGECSGHPAYCEHHRYALKCHSVDECKEALSALSEIVADFIQGWSEAHEQPSGPGQTSLDLFSV